MTTYNPNIKYHKIKDLIIRLNDNLYQEHKANTPQYRNNHSRFPNQQRNQSNQRNNQPGFRNNNPGKRPPNNQNKPPQNPSNHSPNSPSHFQKPNNQWQQNGNKWTPRNTFGPSPMELGKTQNRPQRPGNRPPKSNKPVCYQCNQEGHIRRYCPANQRPKNVRIANQGTPQEQHNYEKQYEDEERQDYEEQQESYDEYTEESEDDYQSFEEHKEERNVRVTFHLPDKNNLSVDLALARVQAALERT
ncbi:hypothetical protein H072_11651 [Dactylellina haptotyla CBS 200.50]|uniref:CCHC-type domain-containing protein n=1 Tax=Dactylellina haptotyla (strain CBS 200.50) TaxID=1284197 RepID=S8BIH1_DACHA|nr:hypothetical protein H072_11651 [Dactylellina haptotyla CBS 200.50]